LKTKYQHAMIIFGIIFSILAVILYLAAIVSAVYGAFITGIFFQVIGAILIMAAKKEHAKTKEQDRIDLERLRKENRQHDEDTKLV